MSERFWKNLSMTVGCLAFGVLFGLVVYSSSLEIRDLDLWLHLRMGYWIVHHGFVPNYDVLSATIAGKPWVNHEWLFQVLVYQIQKTYGFNGLIAMQSLVVAITLMVLLFLCYNRQRQALTVFGLLMVLMVYQNRFTIRPDIFSLLFFAIDMYVLSLHINKRWALYALLVVQILWSNMHGFFFFGPLLVILALTAEGLKRHCPLPYQWNTVGRLQDQEYNALKKILPVLLMACCVNPLTFQGAWYPIGVLLHLAGDNKIFFQHIYELQRPLSWVTLWSEKYCYYKILIVASGLSFVFNRRRIDISSLLVWLIFLAFSLCAIRNLIYFAVVAYMVLMLNAMMTAWKDIVPLRFTSVRFKYCTAIAFKIGIIFWMINFGVQMSSDGYFDFDTLTRKSEFFGVSKRAYPYKAVDFIVREHIRGNFFNDFNSGAYLTGRAHPGVKVFIDGRTEVYGARFFEDYLKIWQEGNVKIFADLERKDNITVAFLNNAHQQIPPKVLAMFHGLKNWRIVYLDDDAVIFLKQTPFNKPWIDRWAVDTAHWKLKAMNLFTLGTKRIDPFPFTNRAYILETLGSNEAALMEAREAIVLAPDYAPAYNILGEIAVKRKEWMKAFEDYRLAAMYAPNDTASRLGLALACENVKEYRQAMGQYQRVLETSPKETQAYLGLARVYAATGQRQKIIELYQRFQKLGLEDKVDVQKIRDIIKRMKTVGVKRVVTFKKFLQRP